MRSTHRGRWTGLTIFLGILLCGSHATAVPEAAVNENRVQVGDFATAVPNQLNYQGYLANAADSTAVTATLEMTFRLYDADMSGSELWAETHPAVEVSDGLFQVLLGSVTSFPTGLFDGSPLWLQTEVGPEALSPRKPLASVAYSQRTANADHAVHADTAGYTQVAGITVADSAEVADNAHQLEGESLSDLDNRYALQDDMDHLDAADGDPANAVFLDDDGNVGIGTTSPTHSLDVNGDIGASTYYGDGSHLTGIVSAPDNDWTISGDDIYHQIGRVGIGTATPTAPLTIHAASGDDILFTSSGNNADIVSAGELRIGTSATQNLHLLTNSNYRVAVTGGGNVGIGTTTPGYRLHIVDDAHQVLRLGTTHANSSIEILANPTGSGGLQLYVDGGANFINFVTSGGEKARITSNGWLGIGTASPAYTLDVNGSVNATTYWGDGSHLTGIAGAPDADWTISGSDMYAGVSGNVGIGTASPAYPLHVYHYAAYSPSYAGYFHAVGHEATGNAYAVYATAQADDENAYGIYSTAASTWGIAYAGYFVGDVAVNGDVQADTLILGNSSKAGMDGGLELYRDGTPSAIAELGDLFNDGGIFWLRNANGYVHTKMETDFDGSGAWFNLYRNNVSSGLTFDGNYSGTEQPRLSITGSSRSVYFLMDQSGDGSVLLPTGSISAGEIMDEPGVSNSLGMAFYSLNGGNIDYAVDTVAITIPGPGYVEVTGGCYLGLSHTNGTDTRVFVAIDKTPANASYTFPGAQVASVPDVVASSFWGFPCTTTRLYEEVSAGTKTYYLNVDYFSGLSGGSQVNRSYLRAKYYPTLYGTLTVAETDGAGEIISAAQGSWDGLVHGSEPERRTITVEDHNARLDAEMAALRAELEALKETMQNQRR